MLTYAFHQGTVYIWYLLFMFLMPFCSTCVFQSTVGQPYLSVKRTCLSLYTWGYTVHTEFNITWLFLRYVLVWSMLTILPWSKYSKQNVCHFNLLPTVWNENIHYCDIRQGHVVAWLKGYFNDGGALNVNLPAGCGVAPSHPTRLVKPMGLDSPHIITHKHLQDHRLIYTFQLRGKRVRWNDYMCMCICCWHLD